MDFGEKVKIAREIVFMSQIMFAKELGVSFTTVNRWENNHNKPNYYARKRFHEFCVKHKINFDKQ